MELPRHDLWLRHVLDQQYRGSSWNTVETRLMQLVSDGNLFFYAWPTEEWAAPDDALDKNSRLLAYIPARVSVTCPGSGPDGTLALLSDLSLTCIDRRPSASYLLPKGTEMTLEVGNVSPILTYSRLSMEGAIARFPYDFDDKRVSPHLFILATPYGAELSPYP